MSRRSKSEIERNKSRVHSLDAALYYAANDYAGGIPVLAMECGKSETSLVNNLTLSQPERRATLEQFEIICRLTQDKRILDAVVGMFEGVAWFPLLDPDYSEDRLVRLFNDLVSRVSKASIGLEQSLSDDGVIDDTEWGELQFDLSRLIGCVVAMTQYASERRRTQQAS
jgi:hypothetical protein